MLIKLGFLPRTKAPEAHELLLINDLWTLAKGQENHGVTFDTLNVILLNFIGVRTKDRELQSNDYVSSRSEVEGEHKNQDEGETSVSNKPVDRSRLPVEVTSLGTFENGRFFLKKGDHSKLFTHFKCFYVHRVQFVGGCDPEHRPKSLFDSYDPEFEIKEKPQISEKTS